MHRHMVNGGLNERRREIPLGNDAMFSAVMQHENACRGLIETIFGGRKVRKISYKNPSPVSQKNIVFDPANKSIRLDVFFEDEDDVYDIELQKVDMGNLPMRARMYSSMMDANMLDKGLDYEALKNSFVIFVCLFDLFGRNLTKYTFKSICEETKDLPLDDGRCIMFLNTKGSIGDSNADMEAFFRYLNGGESSIGTGKDGDSGFVELIDQYVLNINGDEQWRQGYMKYELDLMEKYKKGEANERSRIAKNLKEQGVPVEVISKATNLSVEEIDKIQ